MKILPQKKDIDRAKASERKLQMDEGLALAKGVDALRKSKLLEEKSVEEYRLKVRSLVQGEINQLVEEKEKLRLQNEDARNQRNELLKPLNTEWEKVNAEKERIEIVSCEIDTITSKINNENELASRNLVQSENVLKQMLQRKMQATQLQKEATDLLTKQEAEYNEFLNNQQKWAQDREEEKTKLASKSKELDNIKLEYEGYLESIKKKERLLDIKLRKNG